MPSALQPNVAALATKVVHFTDSAANAEDNHVLGYRYRDGPKCVHLDDEPRFFHTHAPSGFYRRDVIEWAGLRLDVRLHAAFEDAAFEAEYMLGIEDPVIGFVPDAVYAYRRRRDSVIGTMWSKPSRYTTILEHGYLRLLGLRPDPPLWLQNLVLYDLIWFFHEYEQPGSVNRTIDRDVADAFLIHLDEVLKMIDERAIYGYSLHPLPLHIRTALATRKTHRLLRPEGRITEIDVAARRIRVSYFAPPGEAREKSEVITVDGIIRQPLEATTRPIEYYGQTFLVERELLLDACGAVMIEVDGEVLPLTTSHSGAGARLPWQHGAPTEVDGADQTPESPSEGRSGGGSRRAGLPAKRAFLARHPRNIRPALTRRVRLLMHRYRGRG